MNRFRSLGIVSVLLLSFAAYGQNSVATGSSPQQDQQGSASMVDQHLQMLTAKLDLSADQQAKIRPILQRMLDGRQKLMDDRNLSDQQRHQQLKALHEQADREARQFLNDDQKKKLDELESENHHEHGSAK